MFGLVWFSWNKHFPVKVLTFGQDIYIYYIHLLLVHQYSDMEGEAGTQVDDAQKDKEIARNKKAEKEKKREATFEMTTTKKEAPEKGKVSFWIFALYTLPCSI